MGKCNYLRLLFSTAVFIALAVGIPACSPNNVTVDDSPKTYFDSAGVIGTYGMFHNGAGTFTLCNVKRYRDSAFTPYHSFEPVLHIIGLETGVIPNEKGIVITDSLNKRGIAGDSALQHSIPEFYSKVASTIGTIRLQAALDTLAYGSKKIVGGIENCWQQAGFTISPDEQLGLIKRLYFNQLPFQKRSQEIVKKLLIKETNASYQLAYHSSQTPLPDGGEIVWLMGWVEENKHPYFFVLNTSRAAGTTAATAPIDLLKKILLQQGFLMGKR
jgi:beta-lactamase class D